MFDFNCVISFQRETILTDDNKIVSLKYLKGIEFTKEYLKGEFFSAQWLQRKNERNDFFFMKNKAFVFLIGRIYPNQSFETLKGPGINLTAEILHNLYLEYGKDFSKYIKGQYLLFIFDEKKEEYHVITSRSGLLDVYYYSDDGYVIISSSLEFILKHPWCSTGIDEIALIQYHIYDYPLGSRTLFRNIRLLEPANTFTFSRQGIVVKKYYDFKSSMSKVSTLSWEETYDQIPHIFNRTIDLLHQNENAFCSAITSGFDSRTNLSRLVHSGKDVLYYSWGMPGSIELRIPAMIAKKVNLKYSPIYLDSEFEEDYDYFAKQAVLWSDGRGTIRRANHTYAYSLLSKHSDFVITGLIGSELIRPTNAFGHIFNKEYVEIFYSENPDKIIADQFNKFNDRGILNIDFSDSFKKDYLIETSKYFETFNFFPEKYQQLYYFSLTEGFRKYFGHEIHACRIYNFIQSPYIDDDFVDFLLRTPVPKLNVSAFKRNSKSLRLGQLFYIPVIKANMPSLLKITTGRFYTPSQLTSPLYPLSILPGYLRKFLKHKFMPNDTFNTKRWNGMFIEKNRSLFDMNNKIFAQVKYEMLNNLSESDVSKYISVRLYLSLLGLV